MLKSFALFLRPPDQATMWLPFGAAGSIPMEGEMFYIVEIDNGFGVTATKYYYGFSLREVVEDAEADICEERSSFIKRVWPQNAEPARATSDW
jgi:hypothetical protein